MTNLDKFRPIWIALNKLGRISTNWTRSKQFGKVSTNLEKTCAVDDYQKYKNKKKRTLPIFRITASSTPEKNLDPSFIIDWNPGAFGTCNAILIKIWFFF